MKEFPDRAVEIQNTCWLAAGYQTSRKRSRSPLSRLEAIAKDQKTPITDDALIKALRGTHDPGERFELHERLGDFHRDRRDFSGAVEAYQEAIVEAAAANCQRDVVRLVDTTAEVLSSRREYKDAMELLSAHIAPAREFGQLWLRRGVIEWHQGFFEQGWLSFNTAVQCGVHKSAVLPWRGHLLTEWGRYHEAISELDEALGVSINVYQESRLLSARAHAHAQLGQIDDAKRDLMAAGTTHPAGLWPYYFGGIFFEIIGDEERARASRVILLQRYRNYLDLYFDPRWDGDAEFQIGSHENPTTIEQLRTMHKTVEHAYFRYIALFDLGQYSQSGMHSYEVSVDEISLLVIDTI